MKVWEVLTILLIEEKMKIRRVNILFTRSHCWEGGRVGEEGQEQKSWIQTQDAWNSDQCSFCYNDCKALNLMDLSFSSLLPPPNGFHPTEYLKLDNAETLCMHLEWNLSAAVWDNLRAHLICFPYFRESLFCVPVFQCLK